MSTSGDASSLCVSNGGGRTVEHGSVPVIEVRSFKDFHNALPIQGGEMENDTGLLT